MGQYSEEMLLSLCVLRHGIVLTHQWYAMTNSDRSEEARRIAERAHRLLTLYVQNENPAHPYVPRIENIIGFIEIWLRPQRSAPTILVEDASRDPDLYNNCAADGPTEETKPGRVVFAHLSEINPMF